MSKETRPAFMLYASDWLSGTADLTMEEKGIFMDMLCQQWLRGDLPNDLGKLCRMFGGDANRNAIASILHKFRICENGNLQNAKLEEVRLTSLEQKKARSNTNRENSIKGWEKRRANAQETTLLDETDPIEKNASRNAIAMQMESESISEYESESIGENRGVQGGTLEGVNIEKEVAEFIETFGVGQKRGQTETAYLETMRYLVGTSNGMGYRARDACLMLKEKAAQYRAFCIAINQIQQHPPKWLRERGYLTDWSQELRNQREIQKKNGTGKPESYTEKAIKFNRNSGI
jgi:uncharacterized protein YdaU (DUF1376 family)